MSLAVIGPGFGRTGTLSLRTALDILGFGPCHHMGEVFKHPEQVPYWQSVAAGRPVVWDEVFAGYGSQVDWPGALVWRALAEAYPAAKVVLSVRPEDAWWTSFSATIGRLMRSLDRYPMPPHITAMFAAMTEILRGQTFDCAVIDRDIALAAYRRRTTDVEAAISPDRLLVFDVAEGWAPLCRFLERPVPDCAFPRLNSTQQFWRSIEGAPR